MRHRVVMIGNPDTVFVQTPVHYWRQRGVDAVILCAQWSGPATVGDGLPVYSAEALVPPVLRRALGQVTPYLGMLSTLSLGLDPDRVRRALRTWGPDTEAPSLAAPIRDALFISAAADVLEPVCVMGQEAFANGLATALCDAPRRSIMTWGGDVLHYAEMSDVAFALVQSALLAVRYVLTNAQAVDTTLRERFTVPGDRIARIAWGVDRSLFHRANEPAASVIRARHGIRRDARIVMNLRRFRRHWGCDVAWPAMRDAALAHPDVHLVLLDGMAHNAALAAAQTEAAHCGLSSRLTVLPGAAPLATVAELMRIADVGLSLVESTEPLSWSVLQAAACGATLIVGDQPTYQEERVRGLSATLVDARHAGLVTARILRALGDAAGRDRMARDNAAYVARHHDQERELTRLLRIIAGQDTANRLLADAELAPLQRV